MKVIMLSKDNKVFEDGSDVRNRLLDYGGVFDELHVVVFARTKNCPTMQQISNRVTLYSPHSDTIFFIFIKTIGILFGLGRKMRGKGEVWVSSQDPFETGFLAVIISRLFKIKVQIQVHTDFLSPLFIRENLKNMARAWIAKKILPYANSIRVVSQRVKGSLVQYSRIMIQESKIHVLPIFVDIEKIQNQKITFDLRRQYPQFKKIILIASRLEHEKNIPLALFAFSKVIKSNPDVGLIVAGSGSQEARLKQEVKSLKLEANVVFVGWLPDIISAYKTSDILLVTSLYEGYGMSIVEALACGCKVVSTDVGVAKEVGATITNYDPGQITLDIIKLLNREKNMNKRIKGLTKDIYLKCLKNSFS